MHIGPIGQRKRSIFLVFVFFYWRIYSWSRNKIGRIDKTPSRAPDSVLLPAGGNGKLYGLVTVKDSCPTDGKNENIKYLI